MNQIITERNTLIATALKYHGDWIAIYKSLIHHESIEHEYIQKASELKCKTTTLLDSDYPEHIRQAPRAPFVLFYYGDLSICQNYKMNISVVGSRKCSEYGVEKTKEIVTDLVKKDFVIVSGLALGIDTIAHQTAIANGGKTIAVLGCGIDNCYPFENEELCQHLRERHLVLSEFPENTPSAPQNFPIRNRIIASLSKTVLLPEAGIRSGTMITAGLALRGNADVMCVPTIAGVDSGCNYLIKHGAFLVENAQDVLDAMSAF